MGVGDCYGYVCCVYSIVLCYVVLSYFIAFLTLFLAGPNTNTSHGCNQAVVLGGIGAIMILFLLHNSCVASDLLIEAASKNKAAGIPSVCLIMT